MFEEHWSPTQMKKVLVVIASVTLAFYGCEAAGKCWNNWTPFSDENTCLLDVRRLKTWPDARKECQDKYDGSDLVQIWNDKKAHFLHDEVINYNNRWIGLWDQDGDGVYEWLNGSKLNFDVDYGKEGFLDQIRDRKRTSSEVINIIQRTLPTRRWETLPQAQGLESWFVCEKMLDDPPDTQGCTTRACKCDKTMWTYFEKGKKYIMVNSKAQVFTEAQIICEHNGGQLLKVTDGDTKAFIEGVSKGWTHWGSLYWMGLKREGKEGKWMWQDNTSPPVKDLDWATNPYDDLHCGGVIWHHSTKFVATFCSGSNPFICEAHEPCTARIIFTMDGKFPADHYKFIMVVTNDKEMTFDCNGVEGAYRIIEAIFNCTDVAGFNKTGPPGKVTGKVTIDLTFYEAVCTCTLKLEGGDELEDSVAIDFRTRPLFVLEPETMPVYYVDSGDFFTFSEEVYANPPIETYILYKDDQWIIADSYFFYVEDNVNNSLIQIVSFAMAGVDQNKTGLYNLTLSNGIQDDLSLNFRLALNKKPSPPSSSSSSLGIIIGVLAIAGLLALLAFVLMKRAKRAPDEDHVDEELPEDPNEAAAEEDKDGPEVDIAENLSEPNDEQFRKTFSSRVDDEQDLKSDEV